MDQDRLETSLQTQAHLEVEEFQPAMVAKSRFPKVQSPQRLKLTLSCAFTAALMTAASTQGKHVGSLGSQGTGSGTQAGQESSPQGWQFVHAVTGSSEKPWHASSHWTAVQGQLQLIKPIWKEPPTPPHSSARPRRGAALVRVAVSHCPPCSRRQHELHGFAHLATPLPAPAEFPVHCAWLNPPVPHSHFAFSCSAGCSPTLCTGQM